MEVLADPPITPQQPPVSEGAGGFDNLNLPISIYVMQQGIYEAAYPLYGPTGALDPKIVQQGTMGDCWFMSAVISLAEVDSYAIQQMIQNNLNGTYTVTFPGQKPVTITYDPTARGATTSPPHTTADPIWARVIEQAAGEYYNQNPGWVSWLNTTGEKANPLKNLDQGYWPGPAIELLTGKPSAGQSAAGVISISGSVRADWQQVIEDGLKNHTPVVASIYPTNLVAGGVGLLTGHSYAVTGFDKATGLVTIREPNGSYEYDPDYSKRLKEWLVNHPRRYRAETSRR